MNVISPLRTGFFFLILATSVTPAEENDAGTSQNLIIRYSLNDDWYLSSINNLATQGGVDRYAISYVDGSLGRRIGKHWSIDAGYRRAWINIGDDTRDEHRPLLNLSRRDFIHGWFILNRSRLELRLFEDPQLNDRFRFRHHFLAVSPWELPVLKGRWFIEEEFFYEFTSNNFNMNWLTTGFRLPVTEEIDFKLGYRWQTMKFNDNWQSRHVLVTGLIIRF